jgi:hypothetical protein
MDSQLLPKKQFTMSARMLYLLLLFSLASCSSDTEKGFNNIEEIKRDFITTLLTESQLDEGPFHMDYSLRSILFSDNVVSLFGEIFVHAHMPHGWIRYETKTFVKQNRTFKEIALKDLFPKTSQQEFLRSYCEDFFKHRCDNCSYFQGPEPLRDYLELELIKLFAVDHESVIIVFQPYGVGGFAEGPFFVKIPFTELIGKWQAGNPLEKHLPISKNFLSSWNANEWISDVQDDHSIAYKSSEED